jgi:hypothetical protein
MRRDYQKIAIWVLLVYLCSAFSAWAQDYPDMVGTWSGSVRVVSSGTGEVAQGGMLISEMNIRIMIDHQDQESYMGRIRTSQMSSSDPSNRVWGTIRSNGEEALFITSGNARGQLWFHGDSEFEYCTTNMQEELVRAYCAKLAKEK